MKVLKANFNQAALGVKDKGFYTDADLKGIVRNAFQEVMTTLMENEESKEKKDAALMQDKKEVITVQEAADMLGICKPSMYELIHSRAISFRKVGRRIYLTKQAVLKWLNG